MTDLSSDFSCQNRPSQDTTYQGRVRAIRENIVEIMNEKGETVFLHLGGCT